MSDAYIWVQTAPIVDVLKFAIENGIEIKPGWEYETARVKQKMESKDG